MHGVVSATLLAGGGEGGEGERRAAALGQYLARADSLLTRTLLPPARRCSPVPYCRPVIPTDIAPLPLFPITRLSLRPSCIYLSPTSAGTRFSPSHLAGMPSWTALLPHLLLTLARTSPNPSLSLPLPHLVAHRTTSTASPSPPTLIPRTPSFAVPFSF